MPVLAYVSVIFWWQVAQVGAAPDTPPVTVNSRTGRCGHLPRIRTPERFGRRYEFYGYLRYEGLEPVRAVDHPRLLRHHVPKDDQAFPVTRRYSVGGIFDQLPFAGFADHEYVQARARERTRTVGIAPVTRYRVNLQVGIAHN